MFTLDPYAARSCPLKTYHAFHPGMTRPEPVGTSTRIPGSAEFIASVFDRIVAGSAGVVDLRAPTGESNTAQEAACLEAMASGVDVILGGLLPVIGPAIAPGGPTCSCAIPTAATSPGW